MSSHYFPRPYISNPSEDEPSITLDKYKEIFEISGKSMPEDPDKFFTPLMNWLEKYIQSPNPVTQLEFKLEYFNSSSAKYFVEMLQILEKLFEQGKVVKVIWWYRPDDDRMVEKGEDIGTAVNIPFEFRKY